MAEEDLLWRGGVLGWHYPRAVFLLVDGKMFALEQYPPQISQLRIFMDTPT